MKAFAVLAGVVASAAAQWPAGVHPTACPNYPFCGEAIAPAAPAVIPAVPGAAKWYAEQQEQLQLEAAAAAAAVPVVIPGQDLIDQQRAILRFDDLVPQVPGAAAWYAAQQEQMAAMGMNPGLTLHEAQIARVKQAEALTLAYQRELAMAQM